MDSWVPVEETLSVFDELIKQGDIRYIGCANFSAWRLMQALWAADQHGKERFICIQPEYSLISPVRGDFETELAAVCMDYGLGVTPYSPLARGVLTGKYRKGQPLPDSVRAQENADVRFSDMNFEIIEKVVEIAENNVISVPAVAINWLRAKPWVSAPIVGAIYQAQLIGVLDGLNTTISVDEIAELDKVSVFRRPRTSMER